MNETKIGTKKFLSFTILWTLTSLLLALASLTALKGSVEIMFLTTFALWWGYLFSHYVATGEFIDGKPTGEKDLKMMPKDQTEIIGSLVGVIVFIMGMVIGLQGLSARNLPLTFFAALTFLWGYVIMHYAATGEFL